MSPRPLTRRRLLRAGAALAAGALGLGTYSILVEPRWVRVTRLRLSLRDLHPALSGLRLVQLTDIHLGPWTSLGHIESVVHRAQELDPDLVLLTGDYVYRSAEYIAPAAAALARLRPRIATVAVLGNHDWWHGAQKTREELRARGILLVDNARILVAPDRTVSQDAGEGLCIAGVGDLWEDRCLYDLALGGVPPEMPRVLLSHNPDVAEEPELLREGHRVDLMVCGHTHGGQVRLPLAGTPVVPSRYGSRYARGLVQGPACPVFISSGIGTTILPVRLGVRPEIPLIEILCGGGEPAR